MADCRYCGKPAGFLRHQHPDCRRRHDEAAAKIPDFFVKALQSPMSGSRFRETIDQAAAQNFVPSAERDELVRRGLGAMIKGALAGGILTDAEDERINEFQHDFGMPLSALGDEGSALAKARILRALDAGQIPPVNVIVEGALAPRLETDERALWSFDDARYLTFRSRTHYVGGSTGISVRVMRGVYYRVGGFRGEPIKTDFLSNEDSGSLTIAQRNVYFVGTRRALKIPVRKIASAQLYSDGIEILLNGVSAKPAFFMIGDAPFAANLLARLHGG